MRYHGSYSGADVGITENGYEVQQSSEIDAVNNTDAYGGSMIDWVYRGGNVFLQFQSKAYKSGSISPFWPYGSLGVGGVVGRLASAIASSMVLSATAGTPAASSPASLTGSLAILAPNNPATLLFTSKVRNVPVRLQLLYDGSSWFSTG